MLKKFFGLTVLISMLILGWSTLSSSALPNPIKNDMPPLVEPEPENPPVEIISHVIVIDPGHGPWVNLDMEPVAPESEITKRKYGVGATGVVTGTLEREINLNVSLMLRDLLEKDGYTVIMTRTDHETISSNIDRANLANDNNADLMLRIHSDSYKDSKVNGASMLVPGNVGYAVDIVDISRTYGEIILNTLTEEVGMKNRGVITRTDQTGFNWSTVPIMTVELGFLSNPDEDRLLSSSDYQTKLAQALYKGIVKCFNEEKHSTE